MIPQVGDLVEFPLKLERIAKRGKTQTVSRKKIITRGMGSIASPPEGGRYVVRMLAAKRLTKPGWHGYDELVFEEVFVDDVDW